MPDSAVLQSFLVAERYVRQSKMQRWMGRPMRHATGFLLSYAMSRMFRRAFIVHGTLFTGDKMRIPLPAGLDLFLTGIKSHDSEIRLARYLLHAIHPGDTVVDAGAHLGYYALVMAHCVASSGKVIAFEPGDTVRSCLIHNTSQQHRHITVETLMLSSSEGHAAFYEYPVRFSEYNTSVKESHVMVPSTTRHVTTTTLDAYCVQKQIRPVFLKIDVEGGEYELLKGAVNTLPHLKAIAMEVRKEDYDTVYAPALALLEAHGMSPHAITRDGELEVLADPRAYLSDLDLESDNLVFVHTAL